MELYNKNVTHKHIYDEHIYDEHICNSHELMTSYQIRSGSFYRYISKFTNIMHLRFVFAHLSLHPIHLDKTPDELIELFE